MERQSYKYEDLPDGFKENLILIVESRACTSYCYGLMERLEENMQNGECIKDILARSAKMTTSQPKTVGRLETVELKVGCQDELAANMHKMRMYSQEDARDAWAALADYVKDIKGDFPDKDFQDTLCLAAVPRFVKISKNELDDILDELEDLYTTFGVDL